MKVSAILACAGKGERAGLNQNKILYNIDGENCLQKCLRTFARAGVNQIIVTASEQDFNEISSICEGQASVVLGGNTRTQSVKNALKKVDGDIVLIHDGARPFVSEKLILDCIQGANNFGGVIPVIPTSDTVVNCEEQVTDYLGKGGLFMVQTPQAFNTDIIKKAYEFAGDTAFNDDGEVYKNYTGNLHYVLGESTNKKLTFNQDFIISKAPRYGVGFDCHRLVEDRKLILGGVRIPHEKGLLGHSDADVLTHAVMDAILSATSLGDIGKLFPDTCDDYKDADSINLLKQVLSLVESKGFKVSSVSATIMAERPKLKPYINQITTSLASALSLSSNCVGIGATTLEGLGFVGREEGICVHATAVVIG